MAPLFRIKDGHMRIRISFLYLLCGLFGRFICSKSGRLGRSRALISQMTKGPAVACPERPKEPRFVIEVVIALAAASFLNYFVPRLYPWGGEATHL
jgi:hypothetical protein